MKSIIFRPLRRIKKTGKITVASYLQWNKVKTADYNKFNLIISDEYKSFGKDEFVYRHDGELLFFYQYNPAEIPIYIIESIGDIAKIFASTKVRGIDHGDTVSYSGKGIDCQGTPTFSHFTADYLGTHNYDVKEFEPLTVETVTKWFGWFLFQLNNSYLQIGK